MIVQSAPAGERRFVITMAEHTGFAGLLAEAFGNDSFEPVEPRTQMLDLVANHDRGWAEWDRAPALDPATRLPYDLLNTPLDVAVKTSTRSAELNENHHLYCGLLSSMHVCGLYNGRYGLSDRVVLEQVPAPQRPMVEAMLDGEARRQQRLKAQLADDPATAAWVAPDRLCQSYKQLQFFDTLALYFQCTHDAARSAARFAHVPLNREEDVAITVLPAAPCIYRLSPYPFAEDGLEVVCRGRYLVPLPNGDSRDLAEDLRATPVAQQVVMLIAA